MDRRAIYAQIVLRLGISIVFLWFGINQLIDPEKFMGYLPKALLLSTFASSIVLANGIFGTITGLLLAISLWVRPVALIIAIHLIIVIIGLGYNDITVRDFGLLCATIAIFLGGADKWCINYRK